MSLTPPLKPKSGVKNLEKFISGTVDKLIRQYDMTTFKFQRGTRLARDAYDQPTVSDYREELIQDCWVSVLNCQQRHPIKALDAPYLKRVILNTVLKNEQKSRPRRLATDSIVEACSTEVQAPPNGICHFESEDDIKKLIDTLTDTERVVVELTYGFGRGEEYGTCSVNRICRLLGKSDTWVTSRLLAARIKMGAKVR